MKLKKLLSLALLALVACSAWAQEAQEPNIADYFSAIDPTGETEQYLYNVKAGAFFNQGSDWGTRAVTKSSEGLKVKFTQNGDYYRINVQKNDMNWSALDCDNNSDSWVDGYGRTGDGQWIVTPIEGNLFKLSNNVAGDGKYYSASSSDNNYRLIFSDSEDAQCVWVLVNASDYDEALVQARQSNRPCKDWSLVKNVDAFNSSSNFFALYEKNTGLVLSTKEGNEQSGFKTMTLKADAAPTKIPT